MNIVVKIADLHNTKEANDILALLSHYAMDIMGGGEDLPAEVKQRLIPEFQKRNNILVLLAYDRDVAVGLSVSIEGFSTFYAKPLLNLHDFVVTKEYRGKGIAKLMLEKLESISSERGYCKLTLEVLEGNKRAQKIYTDFGFANYTLDDEMGKAEFWHKKLI
jgi:ribosomal protein S18 acetylase RimI-like enzyme